MRPQRLKSFLSAGVGSIALIGWLTLLTPGRAGAQQAAANINGTVFDPTNASVEGAEITVWWQRLPERQPLARGHSGEEGRFRLHYRLPDDDDVA